jgi:hypothetical protein
VISFRSSPHVVMGFLSIIRRIRDPLFQKQKLEIVYIAPKTDLEPECNVQFSDDHVLVICRHQRKCSCNRDNDCAHYANLCQTLKIPSNYSICKVYAIVSCIFFHKTCAICFDGLFDDVKRRKGQRTMTTLLMKKICICHQCGLVIHSECGQRWKNSRLGRHWRYSCFVCEFRMEEHHMTMGLHLPCKS